MNNQQAINLLKNLEQSLDDYCELNEEGKTAFRMAIEALNCSEFPNNSDTISRQAAIEAMSESLKRVFPEHRQIAEKCLNVLPSVQQEQRWIPIKVRPMDAEERKEWSGKLWYDLDDEEAVMFDCPLPDDGQEVWVCSKRGNVWQDTCQIDDGIYLEGNGDWLDIVAWMPFNRPEPWREGEVND